MRMIRGIDKRGRILLPKEWRVKNVALKKVILKSEGENIIIVPYRSVDITKFFDGIEVDVKADLADWKNLKTELLDGHDTSRRLR